MEDLHQVRKLSWILALLLALFLVSPAVHAQTDDAPLVLALYYAWFDFNTWQKPLPDHPLTLYHSTDAATIERHVIQARHAGIDALVQAWYGPKRQNNQTEDNVRTLLDKAAGYEMYAAVSVDMGSAAFLQTGADVMAALVALRDGHAQHAAYLRVDGRPVVFFWKQETLSVAAWETIRNEVDPEHQMLWIAEGARPEYLTVFDGLYLYSVAWSDTPGSVLQRWGDEVRQWCAAHGVARYWVATVMPGYNDYVTGRADAFERPRDDGAFYRSCWEGAIQSDADWIVITSFNEWLEGTHIEPSVNYGDTYLRLTAEFASTYRRQLAPATATPLPTPLPPPNTFTTTPTPTATPVPPTPTLTPTVQASPSPTPTATATPFRLATPTPTPAVPPSPTFVPKAVLPPAPTSHVYHDATPAPTRSRPITVEGSPPKACPLWAAALLFIVFRRGQSGKRQRRT